MNLDHIGELPEVRRYYEVGMGRFDNCADAALAAADREVGRMRAGLVEFRRIVDEECRSGYDDWGGQATNTAVDVILSVFDDPSRWTRSEAP